MASKNRSFCLLLFALLTGLASSAFVFDDVFESHGPAGRSLLQAVKACSVDFENQNYTIITSQCKGPNYQPKPCCKAFLQFSCKFADQINDVKTDCASTMFSYINLYGKYPPALFSSMCRGGKDGLSCEDVETTNKNSTQKSGGVSPKCTTQSPLLMLTAGSLALLFKLF